MSKYTWGWITNDGVRCKVNGETTATPERIIGMWGKLGNTYHETFLIECKPKQGIVNNWSIRPLATLLDINKERTYRFARNKKLVINEIVGAPEPESDRKIYQAWKCKCGHSFYTDLDKIPCLIKRFLVWLKFYLCPEVMDCESCHAKTARKGNVVEK